MRTRHGPTLLVGGSDTIAIEPFAVGIGLGAAAAVGGLAAYEWLRARAERAGWDGRIPARVWDVAPAAAPGPTPAVPGGLPAAPSESRPVAVGRPDLEVAPGGDLELPPRPDNPVRLSQRIVVHLYRYGRIGPDDVGLPAGTQRGIGMSLGAEQSAVSKVLRRLEAAGVLEVRRRHVRGGDRRVNVYLLTHHGELLARELQRRISPPSVVVARPGAPGAREPVVGVPTLER